MKGFKLLLQFLTSISNQIYSVLSWQKEMVTNLMMSSVPTVANQSVQLIDDSCLAFRYTICGNFDSAGVGELNPFFTTESCSTDIFLNTKFRRSSCFEAQDCVCCDSDAGRQYSTYRSRIIESLECQLDPNPDESTILFHICWSLFDRGMYVYEWFTVFCVSLTL